MAAFACNLARAQVSFTGSQMALAPGTWTAPAAAALDGKGNLFIADRGLGCVLELSPVSGGFGPPVTLLCGLANPAGLAADWNGNVFVADTGNNRILMLPVTATGYSAAMTVASGLNAPAGVAVDSVDNIYVADSGNNRVVELPLAAGVYGAPVVVGSGFSNPMGVAVDAGRNLFIADTGNNRIVKEAYTAGAYPAQQQFWNNTLTPAGISVDKSDNLYVADTANQTVWEMTWFAAANRFQSRLVIGAGFASPAAAISDTSGNVYVADAGNRQVAEVVTRSLTFGEVPLGASGGQQLTYNFNIAAGTTLGTVNIETQGLSGRDFADAGGSTCLPQAYASSIYCGVNVRFTPLASGVRAGAIVLSGTTGSPLATAFLSGVGAGPQIAVFPGTVTTLGSQLSAPAGVAVDGAGNVYIADSGNNRVVELPWAGSGYGPQTTLPIAGLINPMGLAVDAAGDLFIASNGNDRVFKLPWTSNGFGPQIKVGTGLTGPSAVAVDTNGGVYITDTLDERIDFLEWTGAGFAAEQGIGSYHPGPMAIAVDGAGDVYFTDPYQNLISELPRSGTGYLTQLELTQIRTSFPAALAFDGNSNMFVLDTGNNRVVMAPRSGSGFGKQLTVATGFNGPLAMALSSTGQLFVADTGNNQVVRIDLTAPAAMSFASTYLGSTAAGGAQVATVANVGNEPLQIASVAYPQDFPEDPGAVAACTATTSLASSQVCEIAVDFVPVAVGSPLAESIGIESNSLGVAGSQLSLSVTGTSLAKLTQTISFPPISPVTYGVAPIPLSVTATSGLAVAVTVISGPAIVKGNQLRITGAGTVVIAATQMGNSAYSAAPTIEQTFSVAPAVLTVTPAARAAIYGAIPTAFSYTITGFVNGDNAFNATTGSPAIVSNASSKAGTGSYVITATQGSLAAVNYVFTFVPAALTVLPAKIQVVADPVVHSYGAPLRALGWYMTGLVNGDPSSVVTGAPDLTTQANSGAPVGTYPIVVSTGTLQAANYTFAGVNGVFTVVPALLTVTASNLSMTYGGTLPALTYWISGGMNGDTLSSVVQGAPAISTTATPGCGAGTYTISAALGSLTAANYTFRFSPGVLTVNKAVLQVVPGNASMTYGGPLPPLAYSLIGFVNGDIAAQSVSGAPALSTAANSTTRPGSYAILSSAGTLASPNYSFLFGTGTLTIGKAVLTVTAGQEAMTYGAALPALNYSFSGFIKGDGASTVQGAPALTTQATSAAPVGSYPILCSAGTLSSAEYTFTPLNGTLTVNPAVIAVKAISVAMMYGAPPPTLTYQLSGLVNGDTAADISGAPLVTSSVTSATPAGAYPISVATGSLAAANYTFTPVNGTITVKKAVLTVTALSQSMTYGSAVPALTYSVTGFVNGDSEQTAISGAAQLSTSASPTSAVGSYLITTALGSLISENYSFVFSPAWLGVNPAVLNVAANNLSMQQGGAVPPLTWSASGWVNGDTPATAMTGAPALTTHATSASPAGSYPITAAQGTMTASNYKFALFNGILVVTEASSNLHRTLSP
jgi:sugar lactone lactonase YvrE